jgi:3-oxoadipate enol-lactonase
MERVAMIERQVADGQVRLRIVGAGPRIWLFHSLLADAGSCLPLAAEMQATREVIIPDLPGFGGSAATAPALDAVADRMAAALAEVGGPTTLLGNGYGSFVALTLALRHPGLVEQLILVGTGAAFPKAGRAAFRGMAAGVGKGGPSAVADTAMRRLFAPEFQAANPALLAERRAAFLAVDPAVFTGACEALATLDLRDAVARLTLPTLIMVGAQDEATPPPMARELAGLLPHATLRELPGLAHVPQLQDPTGFAVVLRAAA